MKKTLIGISVVALVAGISGAALSEEAASKKFTAGLYLGYGTVSMGDINDSQDVQAAFVRAAGGTADVTSMSGGLMVGVEGGMYVIPKVMAGMRIGYLSAGEAKIKCNFTQSAGFGAWAVSTSTTSENTFSASVIPIQVGGRYVHDLNDKLAVSGGLFVGLGLASGTGKSTSSSSSTIAGVTTSVASSTSEDFSGTGAAVDILGGIAYKINPMISAGLDLGYRILSTSLEDSHGNKVVNAAGTEFGMDFSGLTVEAKVSANF